MLKIKLLIDNEEYEASTSYSFSLFLSLGEGVVELAFSSINNIITVKLPRSISTHYSMNAVLEKLYGIVSTLCSLKPDALVQVLVGSEIAAMWKC